MRALVALLLLALVPAVALAQVGPEEPDPKPDHRFGTEHPELFKGFYLGGQAGFSNPRGSFYRNRWAPGPAMFLIMGWRPIPFVSLEGSFQGSVNDVDEPGVATGQITELSAGTRVFPLGATVIEPTFGFAYSPLVGGDAGDVSWSGASTSVFAGARYEFTRKPFWVGADVRYSWLRWVSFKDDAIGASGHLDRQGHGDVVSLTIGGGARF